MSLMTLEGIIKDGQIRLNSRIDLPENAKVYVIFPEIIDNRTSFYGRPHFIPPDQTEKPSLEMVEMSDEWSEEDLTELREASMNAVCS